MAWAVKRGRPPGRSIGQILPSVSDRGPSPAGWLISLIAVVPIFIVVGMGEGAETWARTSGGGDPTLPLSVTAPGEAAALLDLRFSLGLEDEDQVWPEDSDPCTAWEGVTCEHGHVVEVGLSELTYYATSGHQQSRLIRPSVSMNPLQQLPHLRYLNASGFSGLSGPLPVWLGDFHSLEIMDFMSASLSGSIPSSIGRLSNLKVLVLSNNELTGIFPPTIGNLGSLTLLDLSNNELQGRIPESLGNLRHLRDLNLTCNRLQGMVPGHLGQLGGLRRLLLAQNNFRGHIPGQLGGLAQLTHLDLSSNSLTGTIPSDLGNLADLSVLNLANNGLVGAIPTEITKCARLRTLDLSGNDLTGHLPQSLAQLRSMKVFDVTANRLSGVVPEQVSDMTHLESILLADNFLVGWVPAVSSLERLVVLDVSGNFFAGDGRRLFETHSTRIGVVRLRKNCFSHWTNQRSPTDCRAMYSSVALPFPRERIMADSTTSGSFSSGHDSHPVAIVAGVLAVIALIFLVAIVVLYILRAERRAEARRRERRTQAMQRSAGNRSLARKALNIPSGRSINIARLGEAFSYATLQSATAQFHHSNLIMNGHSGDLYKGTLTGNVAVVVKRIDLVRFKKDLYVSELEFIGRIAHTRVVPLLGHCLERDDEKLLVYKYMPNGDLAYALHKTGSPSRPEDVLQSLDWITRLKIAFGVAEGLVYLHHDCSPPLVHRDIKASSILLDDKFEVRLGSLSDARAQQGEQQSSRIGRLLRLSRLSDQLELGLPPSTCSYDVFCFGKVLLELVSGKLGISGAIDPGADAWLDWALPLIDIHDREPLLKLMDNSLIVDDDLMEEVWATAIIAKSCLNPKSSRRPNMRHILRALENPQKVVRDDHSGPINSRHSSYGSWNSGLFGAWRHFSADSAFGFRGSLREEHSHELSGRRQHLQQQLQQQQQQQQQPPAPTGEETRYNRRPSSEIFPVLLSAPTTTTHASGGAES